MARKIKKNDMVCVIAGDYRGQRGRVIKVDPRSDKVYVEGINTKVRHTKPSATHPEGGRLSKLHPVHVSNVMLIEVGSDSKIDLTRVGFKFVEGRKVRYAKRSQAIIQEQISKG